MIRLIVFCFVIACVVIWVKTIVDIVSHDFRNHDKIVWLMLVIFLPVIGTILYYLFGQKSKIEKLDEFV